MNIISRFLSLFTRKNPEIMPPNVPSPQFIIGFVQKGNFSVPYYSRPRKPYRWIPLPQTGHFYYDPVEDTEAYRQVCSLVEQQIDAEMRNIPQHLGMCHRIWGLKRRILAEQYGIDWHTPSQLNPDVFFD